MPNEGTFFRLLEIDAAEAAHHGHAFDELRRGDLQGILIHHVYSPEILNEVVDRLERHDPPFLKTWFPTVFRGFFFGQNLNLAHPDLRPYFRAAAQFREHLQALFPPGLDITDHIAGMLAHLDGGRPFRGPPGPAAGEQYMFTTLRAHLEGGFIPPHCDNEQALRPAYRHLASLVEPPLMSFVLALTLADGGGALELFDYRFEPVASSLMNDDRGIAQPNLDGLARVSFRLPPGSMIVVDSGRRLHQLTPVVGSRKRWSVCSFMALSRQRDAVYCWG
jgi:hypothetical protein